MDAFLAKALENRTDDRRGASGETFLFNTHFPTAADITFAALCVPVLLPSYSRELFPDRLELQGCDRNLAPGCHRMADVAESLIQQHPSARYALRLYENYRFSLSNIPNSSSSSSVIGERLMVRPKTK
jgi:hypothetical protein